MNLPALVATCLSSALAVFLASRLFGSQPDTRRLFLIALPIVLVVVPFAVRLLPLEITVGLTGLDLPSTDHVLIETLWRVVLVVGAVLVFLQIARILSSNRKLGKLPVVDRSARLDQVIDEYAQALQMKRPVDVHAGSEPCSSSLSGRVIVLPASWTQWKEETLRAAIAHELVHLRRRDDLWMGLTWLAVVFFWWLPWLRLLPNLQERAIEESCDDLASFLLRSDRDYLNGVYQVAANPAGVSGFVTRMAGSSMVARFRRFTEFREQQIDSRGLYWALVATLVMVTSLWSIRLAIPEEESEPLRIVGTTLRASTSDRIVVQLSSKSAVSPFDGAIRAEPLQSGLSGHDPPD